MYIKSILTALFITSTVLSSLPADARNKRGKVILGVIGAIAAVAIISQAVKSKKRKKYRSNRRSVSQNSVARSQARAEARRQRGIEIVRMRDIQTRLTSLGHNTGGIDGKTGPMTRRAISSFQVYLDPSRSANGVLSDNDYQMLVSLSSAGETEFPSVNSPNSPNIAYNSQNSPNLLESTPSEQPSGEGVLPNSPFASMNANAPTAQIGRLSDSANDVHRVRAFIEDANFNVYGINLLSTKSQVEEKLANRGITNCQTTTASFSCSNDNIPGMRETITLGFVSVQNREQIHTISRTIQFQTPTDRTKVLMQFKTIYPRLVDADNQMIASSHTCKLVVGGFRKNSSAKLKRWINSAAVPNADIIALASSCDYYYTLSLPEGNIVDEINITLFTGQPITSSLQTESAELVIPF